MRILITKSYEEMSREAAKMVAGQIFLKPSSVLGLATGSTPLGMYRQLIAVHKELGVDFSEVITFNLDEYVGLPPENPESYHYFMQENFFQHVNLLKKNIYLPNGMAADLENEARYYDALIAEKGGIDLQVLGIGRNAHIGFNEPDDKFDAKTHVVALQESTIRANARFFETEVEVPKRAISMGMRPIMLAKRVILLASGRQKAEAVRNAVRGPVSPQVPASILQLHSNATLILDEEAASLLRE